MQLRASSAATADENVLSENSASNIMLAGRSDSRAKIISDLCHKGQHNLSWVQSAEDAVTAVSTGSVDLLIADSSLRGDIGPVEFCRVLKRSQATQFLPVFVSGPASTDREVEAIEAGADAFLSFPLDPRIFRAHVRSGLRRKKLVDRLDDSESVLFSLAMSVEERDGTLGKHCERLAAMGSSIGILLGLPATDIVLLQRAGYLHDIGKVAVPDSVLFKNGPLTPEEWEIMQRHTLKGEEICASMRSLGGVLPIIRHHHEKWDGTGYPDRLRGEEIPLLARIIQLVDIYDALTTVRCYKPALSPAQAIEVIRAETAKGWRDPMLTARFVDMLPSLSEAAVPDACQFSLQALANKLRREENGMAKHVSEMSRLAVQV